MAASAWYTIRADMQIKQGPSIGSRHALAFIKGFLKNPARVSSVMPSSRFLERRLIERARIADARLVVELGSGTGGTTRALLAAMRPDAKLLSIEIESDFHALVQAIGDERLIAHCGTAADLPALLARYELGAPDAVVSGIPFSTIDPVIADSIAQGIHRALPTGGRFVAYQFRDHVARVTRPYLGTAHCAAVWLCVPPMRVFSWHKA
jgi:phosphatidylethanolamine/phosphatidyl-N-methylethanolamine N-methyltransferase